MKSSVLGTLRKITFERTQPHSLIVLSIILFVFEMDCEILFFYDKNETMSLLSKFCEKRYLHVIQTLLCLDNDRGISLI